MATSLAFRTPINLTIGGATVAFSFGESTTLASVKAAEASASAASAAVSEAVALAAGGPNYANIAAGNAATTAGQTFAVDNGDGTISVYSHGAATTADALRKLIKDPAATTAAALIGTADGSNVQRQMLADLTALAAVATPSAGQTARTVGGGDWVFSSSNLSAAVTIDTAKGVFVAPGGGSGSTGAWVRQFTGPVDPKWFAASPSATDNRAAIVLADALAAYLGKSVFFGSDTWNIAGDVYPKATWEGVEGAPARLRFTSGDRLVRLYSYGTAQYRTTRAGATAVYTRALLNNQAADLKQVSCATVGDAANFPAGSIVRIAFGYDPYDADAALYRYDRLHRVLAANATTGIVQLEAAVDVPVQGWGFEPTGLFYAPADWVNAHAYTAGQTCYYPVNAQLGGSTAITGGVFRATTSGTSSGTNPTNDTGVTWERITYDYNGPDNTAVTGAGRGTVYIDGRPVIELVSQPLAGTGLKNIDIWWAGVTTATMGLEIRSTYDCWTHNVKVGSETNPVAIMRSISEGTNRFRSTGYFLDRRVPFTSAAPAFGDRVESIYAASADLSGTVGSRGWNTATSQTIYAESFARLEMSNSRISGNGSTKVLRGLAVDGGGEIFVRDSVILGFNEPLRASTEFASPIDLQWFHNGRFTTRGNTLEVGEKAIRSFTGGTSPFDLYANNRLFLTDVSSPHTDGRRFEPVRLIPVLFKFVPAASQTNALIQYAFVDNPLVPKPLEGSMIVVKFDAWWDTPPAGGSIDLYPRRTTSGLGTLILSTTAASARITLTDTVPTGSVLPDGSSSLFVGHRVLEKTQLSYTSNGSAAGGTIYGRLWALIEAGV